MFVAHVYLCLLIMILAFSVDLADKVVEALTVLFSPENQVVIRELRGKPSEIQFDAACSNSDLLRSKVHWLIGKGNCDGFPRLLVDETIPDAAATYEPKRYGHKKFKFLHKNSTHKAIEQLRDSGLFPMVCNDVPDVGTWDNFAQVLYTFWIYYCFYEGLTITSDKARLVLIYCFYGKYTTKIKSGSEKLKEYKFIRSVVISHTGRYL